MTGFTVSAFLSRNRVSPTEAFEGLELCERKLSCTVLRGLDGSNPVRLLGHSSRASEFPLQFGDETQGDNAGVIWEGVNHPPGKSISSHRQALTISSSNIRVDP